MIFPMQTYQDVSVIHLQGELGVFEVETLRSALFQLAKRRYSKCVLNFERVDHIQYRIVPMLMELVLELKNRNGDLKFVGLTSYNRNIFRFAGVDGLEPCFKTLPEALLAFGDPLESFH